MVSICHREGGLVVISTAAAAAAAACDVPCHERRVSQGTAGSAAADRLSGCPEVDQLCRGLRVAAAAAAAAARTSMHCASSDDASTARLCVGDD